MRLRFAGLNLRWGAVHRSTPEGGGATRFCGRRLCVCVDGDGQCAGGCTGTGGAGQGVDGDAGGQHARRCGVAMGSRGVGVQPDQRRRRVDYMLAHSYMSSNEVCGPMPAHGRCAMWLLSCGGRML